MEYASIPWENHNQGKPRAAEMWTVNLALWFIHVLAGHRYKVAWSYSLHEHENLSIPLPPKSQAQSEHGNSSTLDEDRIALLIPVKDSDENEDANDESTDDGQEGSEAASESTDTNDTQLPMGGPVTPSKKRKREPGAGDDDDPIHSSFSKYRA
jgi:hypothetical protein